jgi:serine/threonine protein kinase
LIEVIQETSYDGKADLWSLGITLLELCEGAPPYFSVHPMRAIFMISSKPAPTLKEPEKWSVDMQDFLSKILVKDADKRASSAELLKHSWLAQTIQSIGSSGKGLPVLEQLIDRFWESMDRVRTSKFRVPEAVEEKEPANQLEDDLNMMTIRSNGLPATRQQIRNASLSRSLTGTMMRSRASSSAPRMESEYDPDATLHVTRNRSITTSSDGYGSTMIRKDDMSSTMVRNDDYSSTLVKHENIYKNASGDYDGTLKRAINTNNGTFNSSSVDSRMGTFVAKESKSENVSSKEGMQAALKYFRTDSIPDAKSITVDSKYEDKLQIDSKPFPPSPPPRPANLKVPDEDKQNYETEVALLDQMTTGANGSANETVEELKKVSRNYVFIFKLDAYDKIYF